MTVQVNQGSAALGTPSAPVKTRSPEKPYVYTEQENMYNVPVRQFAVSRKKSGFVSVLAAQLIISAVLGTALWASLSFGDEGIRSVCEEIISLFR